MLLTTFAIACGLVLGLLRRGSFRSLKSVTVRWWPVVLAGLVLQAAEQVEQLPGQAYWYLAGLFVLVAATMANVHLKGAAITGVGLSLNLMVMLFNQYIPLRWESLAAVNPSMAEIDPSTVEINGLWEVEKASTRLPFLGDIVPVPVTGDVVSFGDLILLAGVVVLVMNLLLRKAPAGLDDFLLDDFAVHDAEFARPDGSASTVPEVIDLTDPAPLPVAPIPDTPIGEPVRQ